MFTGIVQNIGIVRSVEKNADVRFVIETGLDLSHAPIGASISCSGCCLTVVSKEARAFCVDVSVETLSRTRVSSWVSGSRINLELSLRLGDEMGGHIVSGHVDGLARVISVEERGGSHCVWIEAPYDLKKFLAVKGSVALDGVSLTVNEVNDARFLVNIIPHTWENTTFSSVKPDDRLNIEVDMLARYVARMMECGV